MKVEVNELGKTKIKWIIPSLVILLFSQVFTGVVIAQDLPDESGWQNHGTIVSRGDSGAWDRYFYGAVSPCAIVKMDGTYFLYFIGGDSTESGDARHRKLGAATSVDGLNWNKRPTPVITYSPHNDWEEGIFSATAIVDNGKIVVYYGGMEGQGGSVNTDIRVATSIDGINFENHQEVINHNGVSGGGDEIWPTGVFKNGNTWNLYYGNAGWDLQLATGPSMTSLPNTYKVLDGGNSGTNKILGGVPVYLDLSNLAVFVPSHSSNKVTLFITTPANPRSLTQIDSDYDVPNVGEYQTYYWDGDNNRWMMAYLSTTGTSIGLMTQQVGPSPLTGDVDNNGTINIQDIQACINHFLVTQDYGTAADVNQDGDVNVLDVQEIANIILG